MTSLAFGYYVVTPFQPFGLRFAHFNSTLLISTCYFVRSIQGLWASQFQGIMFWQMKHSLLSRGLAPIKQARSTQVNEATPYSVFEPIQLRLTKVK
jgi:hypothetical protein